MKKQLLSSLSAFLLSGSIFAQIYTPVSVSGFNVDGVVEDQPSSNYGTAGGLDIQDHVIYSMYYGSLYSVTNGLPDNGTIINGTSTYQLQPYDQNNVLYIMTGHTDSLLIDTPQSFSTVSLLGFATETADNNTYVFEYTDGTSTTFSNLSLSDWFNGANAVISGFDRIVLTTGTPIGLTTNPRMYPINFTLSCADQMKLLKTIVVSNISTGTHRTCILAMSGSPGIALSSHVINPSCFGGNNGSAAIAVTGGNGPFTYTWSTTPAQTTDSAFGLIAGTYTVSVNDGNGCTFTKIDTLVPGSGALFPAITASANPICVGSSVTLTTGSAATYTWSAGSSTDSVNTLSPTATTTYTVTITNSTGCSGIGTKTIQVNPSPSVSYVSTPASGAVCSGSTITLSGTGAASYVWSGGITDGTAFVPAASTYTVTGTDANNCTASASATISINPSPVVGIVVFPSDTMCQGSDMQLSGTRATTYHWSGPGIVADDVPFGASVTSTYSVTGTDDNGCVGTNSVYITVRPVPTITAAVSPSDTVCYGTDIILTGAGGVSYAWSAGVTNAVAFPLQYIGTYTVTGTDAYGCYNTAAIDVVTTFCDPSSGISDPAILSTSVYPNPNNGDFNISVRSAVSQLGIEVYDIRGRKVYETTEKNMQPGDTKPINLYNAAGLYFVRLTANGESHTTKITIE